MSRKGGEESSWIGTKWRSKWRSGYGMAWYGMVRYGTVRYGTVWWGQVGTKNEGSANGQKRRQEDGASKVEQE